MEVVPCVEPLGFYLAGVVPDLHGHGGANRDPLPAAAAHDSPFSVFGAFGPDSNRTAAVHAVAAWIRRIVRARLPPWLSRRQLLPPPTCDSVL